MVLDGKVVRFRLSPEGKIALRGLFAKASFQAFVEAVDELGVWVDLGSKRGAAAQPRTTVPTLLLKWDYFATAVVDFEPDLKPQAAIGFVKPSRRKIGKRVL